MPTVETWVCGVGGDFADPAAAVTAKVDGRDLVAEDVTVRLECYGRFVQDDTLGTGATMDATHRLTIVGGAYQTDDTYKARGLLFGAAAAIYGKFTIANNAVVDLVDVTIAGTASSGGIECPDLGTGATLTLTRCVIFATPGHGLYIAGTHTTTLSALLIAYTGQTGLRTPEAGTIALYNCTVYRATTQGVLRQGTSTVTAQNVYVCASGTTDFSGTITKTTCSASDASGAGYTQVSESAWVKTVRRHTAMLFYTTFATAPDGAPGKLGVMALFRERGAWYGTLAGNASVAGDVLTGTTGGITYAAAAVTSLTALRPVVRATMPATPASRGLWQSKATGDRINEVTLYIDAAGKYTGEFGNNAGTITTLQFTPTGADELAGTHDYGAIIDGANLSLTLDGAVIATGTLTGTRDATDTHQRKVGDAGGFFLGASASASAAGAFSGTTAPPTLPLPLYEDGTGALDILGLSPLSSSDLQNGGTAAGAPTRGIDGLPLADRRRFDGTTGHSKGAFGYHPTATPGGDKWGAGLISGDVIAIPGPVFA